MGNIASDPQILAEIQILYQFCKQTFSNDRSKFSPKKFTVPQLLTLRLITIITDPIYEFNKVKSGRSAILELPKQSYRDVIQMLRDSPELREVLELKHIPHYSTLSPRAKPPPKTRRPG